MQELSLHLLDIAQNGIKAAADLICISICQDRTTQTMILTVEDNGCGMDEATLAQVQSPFFTTRTTRPVGLGVPFFQMSAQMTGGSFEVESTVGEGTLFRATYHTDHIDCLPLGDIVTTIVTLISMNPTINFCYRYEVDGKAFLFDTREAKQLLEGVPIDSPDVVAFLHDYLTDQIHQIEQA